MKLCPVVPENCCGQVHVPKKERRKRIKRIIIIIIIIITRYDFSMSGIYSGYHNLPTYEMSLKSDIVEFVRHCGGHFENGDR